MQARTFFQTYESHGLLAEHAELVTAADVVELKKIERDITRLFGEFYVGKVAWERDDLRKAFPAPQNMRITTCGTEKRGTTISFPDDADEEYRPFGEKQERFHFDYELECLRKERVVFEAAERGECSESERRISFGIENYFARKRLGKGIRRKEKRWEHISDELLELKWRILERLEARQAEIQDILSRLSVRFDIADMPTGGAPLDCSILFDFDVDEVGIAAG